MDGDVAIQQQRSLHVSHGTYLQETQPPRDLVCGALRCFGSPVLLSIARLEGKDGLEESVIPAGSGYKLTYVQLITVIRRRYLQTCCLPPRLRVPAGRSENRKGSRGKRPVNAGRQLGA
jgi:hypothetical protein